MKSIRNIAFSAFLAFAAFTAVTVTSCNKDECKDVECNEGTCNEDDGSCTCPSAYEGTNCETEVRAKFLKNNTPWTATDRKTGSTDDIVYTSSIVNGDKINEVKIGNFSDDFFEKPVIAIIDGNKITINLQEPDGDDYTVEGNGTYNATDKSITWTTYKLKSPLSGEQSYTGTWK